jgi:hypothetical protein
MAVKKISISPEYTAATHGVFALEKIESSLPRNFHGSKSQRHIIAIPAQSVAGNHVHFKKQETFFAGGSLFLYWKDEYERTNVEDMNPKTGELVVYVIEQNTPHAFKNPLNEKEDIVLLLEAITEPEQGSPVVEVIT